MDAGEKRHGNPVSVRLLSAAFCGRADGSEGGEDSGPVSVACAPARPAEPAIFPGNPFIRKDRGRAFGQRAAFWVLSGPAWGVWRRRYQADGGVRVFPGNGDGPLRFCVGCFRGSRLWDRGTFDGEGGKEGPVSFRAFSLRGNGAGTGAEVPADVREGFLFPYFYGRIEEKKIWLSVATGLKKPYFSV